MRACGNICACRLALALERVPRLQRLDLSNNQLRALPDSVYALQTLETLNVQLNRLTMLSTDVEKLTQLETLDARHNELKILPVKQLVTLQRLKRLHVAGVPDLIQNLEMLEMSEQLKAKVVLE